MSQSHEVDEDTNMAISYTTQSPTGHPHQTLPSFREVRLYPSILSEIRPEVNI
jgi:hypothetical protein